MVCLVLGGKYFSHLKGHLFILTKDKKYKNTLNRTEKLKYFYTNRLLSCSVQQRGLITLW